MSSCVRFCLRRDVDVSGLSGTGIVASGCVFLDTKECVLHWFGKYSSTNIYHCLGDLIHLHGHQGCTKIVWEDPVPPELIKDIDPEAVQTFA
jgi:hypothetical protein